MLKIEQSALLIVEEKKITKNAQEKIYEADYEHFYRAYPKPKNPDKTPGRKKYVALRQKGVSAEDLLKAAENYATANRTTPPQYIKRIATFLGPQEAWKDFVALECETEKQRALSGEEEYMRDALGVGLISQNEYDEWRRKFYGVR